MPASRSPSDPDRSAPGSLSWILPILFLVVMGAWFYYAGSDRERPAPPGGTGTEEQLRIGDPSAIPCNVPLRWRIEAEDPSAQTRVAGLHGAVRGAIRLWEEAVERSLFQAHETEGFPVVLMGEGEVGQPEVAFVERVQLRSGRVISVERRVEVRANGDLGTLTLALARELGRALGLPASDAPESLMNPRTELTGKDPADFPTAADVEALRRVCSGR